MPLFHDQGLCPIAKLLKLLAEERQKYRHTPESRQDACGTMLESPVFCVEWTLTLMDGHFQSVPRKGRHSQEEYGSSSCARRNCRGN